MREDYEKEKFAAAAQDVCADFTRAEKLLAFNNPMMNLCVNGAFVVIIYLGSKLIITSQGASFDVGQLSSTFTYGFQILMSLMQLSMIFVMVTMAEESANRIVEVLRAEPTIANPTEPVHEVADGSIDFDHVSFKYSEHAERDVYKRQCLARVPYIFQRSNLYAIAAIAGSIAYMALIESLGMWNIAAAVISLSLIHI